MDKRMQPCDRITSASSYVCMYVCKLMEYNKKHFVQISVLQINVCMNHVHMYVFTYIASVQCMYVCMYVCMYEHEPSLFPCANLLAASEQR